MNITIAFVAKANVWAARRYMGHTAGGWVGEIEERQKYGELATGIGGTPSDALQQLLVKRWELGDHSDEVRDMLAAEHNAKGMMRNEG